MSETNGNGMSTNGDPRARVAPRTEDVGTDYPGAFPNSKKIHVAGSRGTRVPMREIHLTGGEPPLRVYDTSGPREIDVRQGLAALRDPWIYERGDVTEVERTRTPSDVVEMPAGLNRRTLRGSGSVTQMTYARRGEVTPEMEFVAIREGMSPEFVRDEVARGRAIIPANINHPEIEPMIIGRNFKVKINANIGNSAVSSSIDEEVEKLRNLHGRENEILGLAIRGGDAETGELIRTALRHMHELPVRGNRDRRRYAGQEDVIARLERAGLRVHCEAGDPVITLERYEYIVGHWSKMPRLGFRVAAILENDGR